MLQKLVRKILQATVYDVAIRTNLEKADKLSERFDNDIRFKREDTQPVLSFKLRGAYNCMNKLSLSEKQKGVICASAGNHAQGIAYSANHMKVKATIVMPITTPNIKTDAVKNFGGEWAEIILYGDSFEQAKNYAVKLSETQNLTYVPPFDHLDIIAGQGTIGKEIYEQWRQVDYVFVAVGGGGLISGVSAYLGDIAPHIKVIAIEPEEAACLKVALDTGERKTLPQVGLFCDGVAVAQIGKLPFEIVQLSKGDNSGTLIESEIVTCSNDEVCAAVKDVFEENRSIVEPSGALAVAGMKKYIIHHKLQGKNCLAIICGANMNFDRLRYIAERTEMGENKEAIFAVSIPERTGAFLEFCRTLQGRNITEFNYRSSVSRSEPAAIFVGIALKDGQTERAFITQHLKDQNYQVYDLTDDEIAKTHIRYLIGGHAAIADEQLFRVVFPERPNALLNFLEKLGQDFNITLFHYRNHGAAEGRVLVGLQASSSTSGKIQDALNDIGYECEPVTDNMGYKMFLK